jgi:molybdenum cofactor biosynthesis enzyme MoaA
MKLEEIGFYTLSDNRAKNTNSRSPIYRGEIIVTNKCNFNCPYCRGRNEPHIDYDFNEIKYEMDILISNNIKNIRFSGGEPTLYPQLKNTRRRI